MVTLKLRFKPDMARKFVAFAKWKGRSGTLSREGVWTVAKVEFKNKTEKAKFLRGWAAESIVDESN